jgi:NAD(P)-dependent dehydrogenase (short-subunit alcohol dehydrogenase family)
MRTAVVVGASGALGRGITDRLVVLGWSVVAVGRRAEPLQAFGAAVTPCPADIADDAAVPRIHDAVGDAEVGLAVHCAAAPLGGPILDCPTGLLAAAAQVKVGGLLRLVRGVRAQLTPGSRIVAVGGSLGFDPTPDASTAGVANAGQANLVRQLNAALAPQTTCHTVAPGPVDTERFRRLAAEEARRRGVPVDDVVDAVAKRAPAGRLTTVEDVAWAVALLTEPHAAALAGSTLLLDGGRRTALP